MLTLPTVRPYPPDVLLAVAVRACAARIGAARLRWWARLRIASADM